MINFLILIGFTLAVVYVVYNIISTKFAKEDGKSETKNKKEEKNEC